MATQERSKKRLNFDVSPEVDDLLTGIAKEMGISKSEVIRKGVKLLDLVQSAAQENNGQVNLNGKDVIML